MLTGVLYSIGHNNTLFTLQGRGRIEPLQTHFLGDRVICQVVRFGDCFLAIKKHWQNIFDFLNLCLESYFEKHFQIVHKSFICVFGPFQII